MGKLSFKNSDVLNTKPVVLPQHLNSTNHLLFKPHINYKQLGTVSRSNYLKWDFMIFHQNIYFIYLFTYLSHSIDPNYFMINLRI